MTVTPLPRDPEDEQHERQPRRSPPPAPGRAPSLLDSFNYAFEGDHPRAPHAAEPSHPLPRGDSRLRRCDRASACSRLQLIALVLAIAFVLVAEMLNTAIEGVIDVSTTSFDPNAKLAKDIAAGAVLIASITAMAVGFLVFESAVGQRGRRTCSTGCATRRPTSRSSRSSSSSSSSSRRRRGRDAARRCAGACRRATPRSPSRAGSRSRISSATRTASSSPR